MKRIKKTGYVCLLCLSMYISGLHADAEEYEYDDFNRVIKVTYEDGSYITYGYDLNGNIINTVVYTVEKEETSEKPESEHGEDSKERETTETGGQKAEGDESEAGEQKAGGNESETDAQEAEGNESESGEEDKKDAATSAQRIVDTVMKFVLSIIKAITDIFGRE
ncbi:MAG: hypothetical protein ACI4HQ_00790 [Acetatifactor sp.]